MKPEELQEFYENFIKTVGEKDAVNFFKKANESMIKNPKKFKTQISFASKLL